MASKPESQFIRGVHKYLPPSLHYEKMHNPYRGGTPDVWYSGSTSDLWIEYKFLTSAPKRAAITPGLSALQSTWINGRAAQGRNLAVIVGCPAGGVIYTKGEWNQPLSAERFCERIISRKDLATWIENIVCLGYAI